RPARSELHRTLARSVVARPATAWARVRQFSDFARESPRLFVGCLELSAFARDLVRRYDLQVISAYHLLAAGLASAWVAEELDLPLVTTVFGEIHAAPEQYRRRRPEIEYVLGRSRRILSVSRHCASSLQLLGLQPAEVLYYGIDTSRFHPDVDGSKMRRRLGLSSDDFVVLFVARMVREMGLHVLLASIPE